MKPALAPLLAALLIVTCLMFASTTSSAAFRNACVGVAISVTFLLGLGYGERARAAYNRDVMLANKLLAEQNDALREANSRLLRQINGPEPNPAGSESTTPHQKIHDGSEGQGGPRRQSGDAIDRTTHGAHDIRGSKRGDGSHLA